VRRAAWPTLALILCSHGAWAATGTRGAEPENPLAEGRLPQYIFFNKSPTASGPLTWRQSDPACFTPQSFLDIVDRIGTRGNDRLRIGVSFPFSILEGDVNTIARSLTRLLDASQATGIPVLITLDGQNWWESRPDLWNWWDPSLPGFDRKNRFNVEWTGWGPEHAVKVGWRNWGRQHRVRPAPNLASPRFLAEHWSRYDVLIPIIVRWYRQLPHDRKYLFGGLKLGWEASINVNAYYHDDGNRIFERSPLDDSRDPTMHDPERGWTFGHNPPLGYAAVYTSGIRKKGELTKEDVEKVVHRYLESLCRQAARRGVPRYMIFTHQGGTYAPWDRHMSFKPAMNDYSIPGWSFYTHDPPDCGPLGAELDSEHRRQWAASEWWRGAADTPGWMRNFERTLTFKDCRFVCVYNWEQFVKYPEALAAVRNLADKPPRRQAADAG